MPASHNSPKREPPAQFRWYLAGMSTWFAAFGIQSVMFSYLVTTELHAPADKIGLAQASPTLVATLLLLFGGAVADQIDNRRLLILFHALAAVPAAVLSAVVAIGWLSYAWLITYGLAMGAVASFIIPARESMLTHVVGSAGGVQKAVTTTIGFQFAAQILGFVLARLAALLGAAPLILAQAAIQLFGAYSSTRLDRPPPLAPDMRAGRFAQLHLIADGLNEVRRSDVLLPINILAAAIGVFFIGSFLVVLPVILRDEYGGDVQQFSTLSIVFWGGSILSSQLIARVGTVLNRGRLVTLALAMGVLILVGMSMKGPLWALYALTFIWGTGAGVTISMMRTILQEYAPAAHRARILSAYQLGFTGGMAVGALAMGLIVRELGARQAALAPALAMMLVIVSLLATTKLWRITARAHASVDATA